MTHCLISAVMKATSNVTAKLTKRIDWALTRREETFTTGSRGSDPPNESLCCNIRRSRIFVRSMGFGWINGASCTMKAVVTVEKRPA